MHCHYTPRGVCSTRIEFDLDGDVVTNIRFTNGCDGNLQAIGRAVDGLTVDRIEALFSDIRCGFKDTSCSAQLAKAVRSCYEKSKKAAAH
ncbi:MAG: TIGR03905 family TSCPD domain-containing protein [Eubacteriales bacterium]|jgi:uncharacterized protein (TIGR03905 family)